MNNGLLAVQADALVKHFGRTVAVSGVSFEIYHGEIFSLLGPNGSGKSTTVRMLCGLLQPDSGRVLLEGTDIRENRDEALRRIGYMSQQFSLYDELTVQENLEFYGRAYGLRAKHRARRLAELTDRFGLGPLWRSQMATLSGGWKQRLALACSIVHEPGILLLDEPTAGVDPVARRELWDLLFQFAASGMALLVTTHYMDEVERCTHVGYLYDGEMIAAGTPEELRQQGKGLAATDHWLAEVRGQPVSAILRALHEQPGTKEISIAGDTIRVMLPQETYPEHVVAALKQAGAHGVEVSPTDMLLEDVFVAFCRAREAAKQ